MNKTYNLLPFLLAVLCSCNNQSQQASSNANPYKDMLIYKETVKDDIVVVNESGEEEYSYFYIIEKKFEFDNIRYIKGFHCSDDSVTYRYSAKFRVTPDTLFRCESKEDDKGKPYLIKSDKECIFNDGFFQARTQFEREIINNGKKLFKFNIKKDGMFEEVLYCDSEFNIHKIEEGFNEIERNRILLDSIPKSIAGIVYSIQKLEFNFK